MNASDKVSVDAVRLESSPINSTWIVSGEPCARSAELSRSRDGSAVTMVWDCTAGEFDWKYRCDETVHILEGEAIVDDGSRTHTIQAGDVLIFRAGSNWRWRVPLYVKKVAFLRTPLPGPAAMALRVLRALKAMARGGTHRLQRAPTLCWLASWWAYEFGAVIPAPAFILQ
jgi:uncharacterized cupin superfamily protein